VAALSNVTLQAISPPANRTRKSVDLLHNQWPVALAKSGQTISASFKWFQRTLAKFGLQAPGATVCRRLGLGLALCDLTRRTSNLPWISPSLERAMVNACLQWIFLDLPVHMSCTRGLLSN
jgi:hypothetical protein